MIEEVLKEWMNMTCVRFDRIKEEKEDEENILTFVRAQRSVIITYGC